MPLEKAHRDVEHERDAQSEQKGIKNTDHIRDSNEDLRDIQNNQQDDARQQDQTPDFLEGLFID